MAESNINEDGGANVVGGGAIAGVGVNNPNIPNPPQGEPGVDLSKSKYKAANILMGLMQRKMMKEKGWIPND